MKAHLSKGVYFFIIIVALAGIINSPTALILGFVYALTLEKSFKAQSQKAIGFLFSKHASKNYVLSVRDF